MDFNKLTIRALNSSFSYVFDISSTSGYVNVRDCKIIAPVVATTSTNNSLVYGTNNTVGNLSFVKNTFTGGSCGIYYRGFSTTSLANNCKVDSNTFLNQYYTGIYYYYLANQYIRKNTFTTTVTYTGYYGILSYYVDSTFEITRNYIYTTTANGHGIATYYCDGTASKNGLIANNVIRIGTVVLQCAMA
jgi:parallel beta-helix repeat protein